MNTRVGIVGGGLSGLLVAHRLTQHGTDFKLFEANTRFGGRILSLPSVEGESYSDTSSAVDLGPSWFWPGQPNVANLIKELNLEKFVYSQVSAGDSVMEYGNGSIVSGHGSASMAGSYRLSGGIFKLVHKLLDCLSPQCVITQAQVKQLQQVDDGMIVDVALPDKLQRIHCEKVVLALPPRVLAKSIAFVPPLPEGYIKQLISVPTWMAGQAKFVAIYETPFWAEQGLSGDGLSQLGPLVEIHDASPQYGGPYALFGFVGIPAQQRKDNSERLKLSAISQLERMFGERASEPLSVHLKDWALDPLTAIDLDWSSPGMHPSDAGSWLYATDHNVVWAGTESSESVNHSNGYLEGAVESGERAASVLIKHFGTSGVRVNPGEHSST